MNAKKELLSALVPGAKIKCATVRWEPYWIAEEQKILAELKVGHSRHRDLGGFFDKLDFNYDNGFGSQEIYGVVWLTDGTWLSRGEYDGSEWWIYNICPAIPENLK